VPILLQSYSLAIRWNNRSPRMGVSASTNVQILEGSLTIWGALGLTVSPFS